MKKVALLGLVLLLAAASHGWALTATGTTGFISVANDAGLFYQVAPYYNQFQYLPGGTNQLKINSTATSGVAAQLTGTAIAGSYNGDFWITTNGGKGGNDDIILGVAITGPISSNFALTVTSNGYVAVPDPTTRPTVTAANWVNNVFTETFTGSDFIYGPQSTRPENQSLYSGQGSAEGMMMFIDLGVCNRTGNLSDQVVFSISGLYAGNVLAFSGYAWDLVSTGPDAIRWTTPTSSTGYTITGAGVAPVPIPAAVWLLGPALAGLVGMRRRLFKR